MIIEITVNSSIKYHDCSFVFYPLFTLTFQYPDYSNDIEYTSRLIGAPNTIGANSFTLPCQGSDHLYRFRSSCFPRTKWHGCVAIPRYPSPCLSKQWYPEHDCRGSQVDQCKDGNMQGGALQSDQARYQKRLLALCSQLLPLQWLHLELWRLPSGIGIRYFFQG